MSNGENFGGLSSSTTTLTHTVLKNTFSVSKLMIRTELDESVQLLMFAVYFPLSTVYSEINIMGITVSNKKYNFFHKNCESLIDCKDRVH